MPRHIIWGGLEDLTETSASSSSTSRGSSPGSEIGEAVRVHKGSRGQKRSDDVRKLEALNVDPDKVTFLPLSDSSGASGNISGIGGAGLLERELTEISAFQAASILQDGEDEEDRVSQEGVFPIGVYQTHRIPLWPTATAQSLNKAEDAWRKLHMMMAPGWATTATYNSNTIWAPVANRDYSKENAVFQDDFNSGGQNDETLNCMLMVRGMAFQQSPTMGACSATTNSAQQWSKQASPQPASPSGNANVSPPSFLQSGSQAAEEVLDSMLKGLIDACSDSEEEFTDRERESQCTAQQQCASTRVGVDDGEIVLKIPFDDHGVRTSIGSRNLDGGECVSCASVNSRTGCLNGVSRSFCPMKHQKKKARKRNKQRPCKGKRERFKKFLNCLTQQILCDPYCLDPASLHFPSWIEMQVKKKMVAKLHVLQEQVRAQRGACRTEGLTHAL